MKLLKAALCLTTAIAIGTISGKAQDSGEIPIGVATSFSGWMAAFDTNPTRAAELAVEDINAKGGVLGKKLKIVHIDTKNRPSADRKGSAGACVAGRSDDFDGLRLRQRSSGCARCSEGRRARDV